MNGNDKSGMWWIDAKREGLLVLQGQLNWHGFALWSCSIWTFYGLVELIPLAIQISQPRNARE